jgi:hypothetical protein
MVDDIMVRKLSVLARVKKVIAAQKRNTTPRDIYASQPLRTRRSDSPPGLGFNVAGLTALTLKLNAEFSDLRLQLAFDDVLNPKVITVRHLYLLIWGQVSKGCNTAPEDE